jgi:RNA polymerase sigma factor (sigma-70 family)
MLRAEVSYPDLNIETPLIDECRKGSIRAQYKLYNQYSKAMFNLAFRMMNNREDAEDRLQEAFLECFHNISNFRFESTFGAWLKRIVINRCINELRKKRVELIFCENLPEHMAEEEPVTLYDTMKISRGIEQLPDGYRIILTLYLLEGYDHTEISQILGISESTSKSQYSRAKDKLRAILSNN